MSPTLPRGTEEQLRRRLESLRDLALLPAKMIQETVDEAVTRGRITRTDAAELSSALLKAGRQQSRELLAEIEQALGRVRRATGAGPSFPIDHYDDLKAAQVVARLDGLTPPQLRKVRDHETRHGARKTVLAAIAKRLAG